MSFVTGPTYEYATLTATTPDGEAESVVASGVSITSETSVEALTELGGLGWQVRTTAAVTVDTGTLVVIHTLAKITG